MKTATPAKENQEVRKTSSAKQSWTKAVLAAWMSMKAVQAAWMSKRDQTTRA
jgi:hypothetical protein